MAVNTFPKLIHLAQIKPKGQVQYLLLKQVSLERFVWFANDSEQPVEGGSIGTAIRLARKHWRNDFFRTVICGFRYTLPERDEHGINALYYQMVASYRSANGVYYDDEAGHNCIVNFASQEALSLWKQLDKQQTYASG